MNLLLLPPHEFWGYRDSPPHSAQCGLKNVNLPLTQAHSSPGPSCSLQSSPCLRHLQFAAHKQLLVLHCLPFLGSQLPPSCCDSQRLGSTSYPWPTSRLWPIQQPLIHATGHTPLSRKSSLRTEYDQVSPEARPPLTCCFPMSTCPNYQFQF